MADEFKPSRKEIEGNEKIRSYYQVTLLERIAVALERIAGGGQTTEAEEAPKKGKKAGGD